MRCSQPSAGKLSNRICGPLVNTSEGTRLVFQLSKQQKCLVKTIADCSFPVQTRGRQCFVFLIKLT